VYEPWAIACSFYGPLQPVKFLSGGSTCCDAKVRASLVDYVKSLCKESCKIHFCAVYIIKFEIASEIKSRIRSPSSAS
jgi:hypothetical protein